MTDNASPTDGRVPVVDFIIIGAMKSGTTTLHGWLDADPEVAMCTWKEPAFFSDDDHWARGVEWYDGLFPDQPGLRGEASVAYTDPRFANAVAGRLRQVAPDVRLIYVVRNPIERARSHYRHQVQRGREKRSLVDALSDPDSVYLAQSKYWSCLRPFTERFSRQQILVVRFEDLFGDGEDAYGTVRGHVGLRAATRPDTVRNVTAEKEQYTWLMRRLWERGWLPEGSWIPGPLRRLGRRVLLRRSDAYEDLLSGSEDPIPEELLAPVWDDVADLGAWMGRAEPLWVTGD